jgi:hypothetical protein
MSQTQPDQKSHSFWNHHIQAQPESGLPSKPIATNTRSRSIDFGTGKTNEYCRHPPTIQNGRGPTVMYWQT